MPLAVEIKNLYHDFVNPETGYLIEPPVFCTFNLESIPPAIQIHDRRFSSGLHEAFACGEIDNLLIKFRNAKPELLGTDREPDATLLDIYEKLTDVKDRLLTLKLLAEIKKEQEECQQMLKLFKDPATNQFPTTPVFMLRTEAGAEIISIRDENEVKHTLHHTIRRVDRDVASVICEVETIAKRPCIRTDQAQLRGMKISELADRRADLVRTRGALFCHTSTLGIQQRKIQPLLQRQINAWEEEQKLAIRDRVAVQTRVDRLHLGIHNFNHLSFWDKNTSTRLGYGRLIVNRDSNGEPIESASFAHKMMSKAADILKKPHPTKTELDRELKKVIEEEISIPFLFLHADLTKRIRQAKTMDEVEEIVQQQVAIPRLS